ITVRPMWRSAAKDNLRPQRKGYFGAQSHTPRNRCVRFVFGIAAASRNTRFQAACWALPGPDLHRPIAPASLAPCLCHPTAIPQTAAALAAEETIRTLAREHAPYWDKIA